ncbi:hypothetical protein HDU93_008409 [Gonapodya sp. JEL0774]|nr:hypothetical protein HDU93_008409 [Gonapodya sp. JEL0774]
MCESHRLPFDILGSKPTNDVATGSWTLPFEPPALAKAIAPPSGQLTYHHPLHENSKSRWMSTLAFKRSFLLALLQHFPRATNLTIYEDRIHHVREFDSMGAEWTREGIVQNFECKFVEPLSVPMEESRERAFVLRMIEESNSGLSAGRLVLHADASTAIVLERVPAPPALPFTHRELSGFPVSVSAPLPVYPPSDPWFFVTYSIEDPRRPGWYVERNVVAPARAWQKWEVVQIVSDVGKHLLAVNPDPPSKGDFSD